MTAAKSVLNDSTDLSADAPLQELGIDSLGAIEFRDSVQSALNVRLSATVLFDHPTVDALTKFLLQEVGEDNDTESKPAALVEPVTPFEAAAGVEVAVVGMACRFPASDPNPREFWRMLLKAKDCISDVPLSRFDINAYNTKASTDGKIYTCAGGTIRNIDSFDCHFFSISPLEAKQMDPRQRVALEVSYEALSDAGVERGATDTDVTGVFVGSMNHETALEGGPCATAFTVTAAHISILSNRISYVNGFSGPSVTLDTACSSSLVALDFALSYMASQAISQALVLGVNLMLRVEAYQQTCKAHMLSIDGRCKTFDASANGYVRSEGCGAILVKALPRHSTDPRAVYAWIRGAANNHVGRSASLTAPNGPAQQAVIRAALHDAQVKSPADVSVLEAHGTGTSLGDPIEIGAIRAVYCNGFADSPPLIVGALKSLMGHSEGAAGIAGLIKLILVLQHRMATPNLHLNMLNPHIDVTRSDKYRGLMFPSKCVPLDGLFGIHESQPLLGAVSSFGFGGSNAHAIVEVAPTFKSTW
ncbi:type I fatty acid synthase, putative, partial [Eimeria tenella]